MYSKEELLSKNITELQDCAEQIGVKIKSGDSQEDIIYSILDKQAEIESSKNPLGTKRRRVRIVKKDTDHVYSVNGKEGENFDLKKNKVSSDAPSIFNDKPVSAAAKPKAKRTKTKQDAAAELQDATTADDSLVVEEPNLFDNESTTAPVEPLVEDAAVAEPAFKDED